MNTDERCPEYSPVPTAGRCEKPAGHPGTHLLRKPIVWDTRCDYCIQIGVGFGPNHDPSAGCQSGRRPHCTCDGCF